MAAESSQSGSEGKLLSTVRSLPHKLASLLRRFYRFLAPRAHSVILFGALFCTLSVKLFHAWRIGLLSEYFSWILTDLSILLTIEVILALLCFRWPHRWLLRTACIIAVVVCTWSVVNASWLIRT